MLGSSLDHQGYFLRHSSALNSLPALHLLPHDSFDGDWLLIGGPRTGVNHPTTAYTDYTFHIVHIRKRLTAKKEKMLVGTSLVDKRKKLYLSILFSSIAADVTK